MMQKELNEENQEIRRKAYELYEKHGFKDGNDFVDWLEAEKQTRKPKVKKQTTKHSGLTRNTQLKNILLVIVGVLCVIVVILLLTLLKSPRTELSEKSLSELKVMMLALEPKDNEKVVVFGDTHFDFDQSTLSEQAKNLLDADVRTLKENPQIHVRMAGYTSAKGTEDVNQQMSEKRAGASAGLSDRKRNCAGTNHDNRLLQNKTGIV